MGAHAMQRRAPVDFQHSVVSPAPHQLFTSLLHAAPSSALIMWTLGSSACPAWFRPCPPVDAPTRQAARASRGPPLEERCGNSQETLQPYAADEQCSERDAFEPALQGRSSKTTLTEHITTIPTSHIPGIRPNAQRRTIIHIDRVTLKRWTRT